uniref:Uncharacterized protein n=1 Tax=virus sp. ctML55 TaxID=2827627 RepID=A0A8S5RHC2_9VIRU|nr:MAG TPA: hypothetical protein [virus sp. ctML55]
MKSPSVCLWTIYSRNSFIVIIYIRISNRNTWPINPIFILSS